MFSFLGTEGEMNFFSQLFKSNSNKASMRVIDDNSLIAVNETTFQTNAIGATFLVLPNLSCAGLQVYNDSGTTLEFSKNDNTATIKCFASTYCIIDGITNSNQIKVKRLDSSNTRVTVTYSILN